jgi:Ala-tRNA(Pro) deacylase
LLQSELSFFSAAGIREGLSWQQLACTVGQLTSARGAQATVRCGIVSKAAVSCEEAVMIPSNIRSYLEKAGVRYALRQHTKAVGGQELADTLKVTGWRVAKSVMVQVDGQPWIAVIPAAELLEPRRLAAALGAGSVRLLEEEEFGGAFPNCELGAEPPFGRLFGFPVVVDSRLAAEPSMLVRAGSHHEVIEISLSDFERLEQPKVAHIALGPTEVMGQQLESRP